MDNLDYLRKLVDSYPNHYGKMLLSSDKQSLLSFVNTFDGGTLKEKVYVALNGNIGHRCLDCGKNTPFISFSKGYREYCDSRCQNSYLKKTRLSSAIKKLNELGSLEYISGYDGSHSKVTVKNNNCGCTFEATYLNLFTNPNYCPTHGKEDRTIQLVERNELGLTAESKQKRKLTFQARREEKISLVRQENQDIEKEVLSFGRDFLNDFVREMSVQYRSNLEKVVSRFPIIHEMIKDHYGDRFGQKVYNLIHNIDSADQHPKCECGALVKYRTYSNKYHDFCSIECKSRSENVAERTRETMIKNHGVPYPMQNREILRKMWRSSFRLKDVVLPSGRTVQLMGYEPQVLNYLLETEGYSENDFEFDEIPTFRYAQHHYYLPDFYVPEQNLIIEVKSDWTFEIEKEINLMKADAVRSSGYEYRLIIWDDTTHSLK